MPEMEYFLVKEHGSGAGSVFAGFARKLNRLLDQSWHISPGTYHSATSQLTPREAGMVGNPVKVGYIPIFLVCVQVEREVKEDA